MHLTCRYGVSASKGFGCSGARPGLPWFRLVPAGSGWFRRAPGMPVWKLFLETFLVNASRCFRMAPDGSSTFHLAVRGSSIQWGSNVAVKLLRFRATNSGTIDRQEGSCTLSSTVMPFGHELVKLYLSVLDAFKAWCFEMFFQGQLLKFQGRINSCQSILQYLRYHGHVGLSGMTRCKTTSQYICSRFIAQQIIYTWSKWICACGPITTLTRPCQRSSVGIFHCDSTAEHFG